MPKEYLNKSEGVPLYNSIIIDTYLKLIKKKYHYVDIFELLSYASINTYEVADPGHWFTQEQIDLFYEKAVQLTGNINIAREAGRYASSPDALGILRQSLLGMFGPTKVYEKIGKAAANFTRSTTFGHKKISPNEVEITATPLPGVQEKSFQCENRIGFLETVVLMLNNEMPTIAHPECIFTGGDCCRYHITWQKQKSSKLSKLRNLLILFTILISAFFLASGSLNIIPYFIGSALVLVLAIAYIGLLYEKHELYDRLKSINDSTESLIRQTNTSYNNAILTNEIGQAINKQSETDDVLQKIVYLLEKRLDYDRAMLLLAESNDSKLVFRSGYGYTAEQQEYLKKTSFNLGNPESKGIFVLCFRQQKPFIVNELDEIKDSLSARSLNFTKKLGAQSFVCCPIVCEGRSLGILAVDNKQSKRPIMQSDMSLLMGIANFIGISIRNAELLRSKTDQFQSLLRVLAATTDARDFLTAGHSEKVTEYSLGICGELGLPQEYCEVIRVAALLHDYGKIAIPDSILKKEGRLSEAEYELVKTHSEKTREILKQIKFEGAFSQIPEISGAHHEKIDGTGYPLGLKGKDIPLGAKIIAVADFFEAITSMRHYREPMPIEDAFQMLREGIGTHFEPKFVEAFITYFRKTYPDNIEHDRKSRLHREQGARRIEYRTQMEVRASGKSFFCTSVNLSPGGMFLISDEDLSENSSIEVVFSLSENFFDLISAKARVAWTNHRAEKCKPSLPAGFGIEFLDIKASSTETIRDFISQLSRKRQEDSVKPFVQLPLDISYR